MAELLQRLVTKQAERRPEAIALVMNDERMSYSALEEASNQLARQLRAVGCVRGDRVCFLLPKSPVMAPTRRTSSSHLVRPARPRACRSHITTRFVSSNGLPQNGNGKIDRRALREQFQHSLSQPMGG